MHVEGKPPFDPKLFLVRVEAGRTGLELHRRQIVFSQEDPADAVSYVEKPLIELRVLPQQGKEAILASLGVGDFFGEGCLAGQIPLIGRCMGGRVSCRQNHLRLRRLLGKSR